MGSRWGCVRRRRVPEGEVVVRSPHAIASKLCRWIVDEVEDDDRVGVWRKREKDFQMLGSIILLPSSQT
ncbi:hypothetical protein VNO80_24423 [Phaseolus coccineus]|uniref:Uncharacterized protein n=1 Tax=Phaseolus coccineus TaxID=3886 RepID=A0AAN9QN18_PHACN